MNEKFLGILSCILGLLLVIGGAIAIPTIQSLSADIDALELQRDGRSRLIVDLESRLGGLEQRLDSARAIIETGLRTFEEDLGRAIKREERYQRDKAILDAIGKAILNFTETSNVLSTP